MQPDRHITLKCGTVLRLADLEAAGLSYVPCGQVDGSAFLYLTRLLHVHTLYAIHCTSIIEGYSL